MRPLPRPKVWVIESDAARLLFISTTAVVCGLSFLQRRCEAMSSRSEAEDWAEELEAVAGRIAPRFGRAEPRRRALAYLQGLLAPLERKNGWHLAGAAGDHTPDGMQEFLARVHWDADALRDDLRAYVIEHLGDDDAVLVLDERCWMRRAFSRRAPSRPASTASTPARRGASRTARSAFSLATPAAMVGR